MAEYVLLVTVIALVAIVGVQAFGDKVLALFNDAQLPF
jgi:Flp pilus assembly pilin Flp